MPQGCSNCGEGKDVNVSKVVRRSRLPSKGFQGSDNATLGEEGRRMIVLAMVHIGGTCGCRCGRRNSVSCGVWVNLWGGRRTANLLKLRSRGKSVIVVGLNQC